MDIILVDISLCEMCLLYHTVRTGRCAEHRDTQFELTWLLPAKMG